MPHRGAHPKENNRYYTIEIVNIQRMINEEEDQYIYKSDQHMKVINIWRWSTYEVLSITTGGGHIKEELIKTNKAGSRHGSREQRIST